MSVVMRHVQIDAENADIHWNIDKMKLTTMQILEVLDEIFTMMLGIIHSDDDVTLGDILDIQKVSTLCMFVINSVDRLDLIGDKGYGSYTWW